jgi:hypothetical protein
LVVQDRYLCSVQLTAEANSAYTRSHRPILPFYTTNSGGLKRKLCIRLAMVHKRSSVATDRTTLLNLNKNR